ncbi:MAG: hypothetical protein KDD51_11050 [Bdellovibrionales bacterium]|nr:hypothetical protein [Bdellovibrionales bacterium]
MRHLVVMSLFLSLGQAAIADLHYYTSAELAERWEGRVHPGETPRGTRFLRSIRRGGFWIGCAATVAAYQYGDLGKVFHRGVIGATFVRFTLNPARPSGVRFGAFSDEIPQTLFGIGSFTTGRDNPDENQLIPDVTGLSIALMHGDRWVPWTSTASRGAFARNGERFARLAGFSAIGRMALGLLSPRELAEAHVIRQRAAQEGQAFGYPQDNGYLYSPGSLRSGAMALGGLIGEGVFGIHDPRPGIGTLGPAVFSGRRSPFPGYKDVGFGTDTRLLTESVPFESRRAFRLSFSLADTETNRQLLTEIPSLYQTVVNNVRGTPVGDYNPPLRLYQGRHLTAQFDKWVRQKGISIDYDVWMQLDDPASPRLTPIEAAHLGWYSEKILVGRLSLLSFGDRYDIGHRLNGFARRMHLGPGEGYHLPVGDLPWYRSVGSIIGREGRELNATDFPLQGNGGAVVGAYPQSAALRVRPSPEQEIADLVALYQMAEMDLE